MSEIKIERPSPNKLKELGVENWAPWECEPSQFDWQYEAAETAYVLEGKVKVRTASGEEVEINQGDLVHFPEGLKCNWQVVKKVRKLYAFL